MATYNCPNIALGHTATTLSTDNFAIHCHHEYEIYYFIEGNVDYLIEGKLYHPSPHSLLLMAPYVLHGVRINTSELYHRYTIHFNPECLHIENRTLLMSQLPDVQKISDKEVFYEGTKEYHLDVFADAMEKCFEQPDEISSILMPIYLEAFLSQLTVMCSNLKPVKIIWSASSNIAAVISYLNTHLSESITLDSLSEKFFISKHHLNRAFKKATGTTVIDYIIYKRIVYANQLLLGGYSANEASIKSGFKDYSAFYRAYKRITGDSPIKSIK